MGDALSVPFIVSWTDLIRACLYGGGGPQIEEGLNEVVAFKVTGLHIGSFTAIG